MPVSVSDFYCVWCPIEYFYEKPVSVIVLKGDITHNAPHKQVQSVLTKYILKFYLISKWNCWPALN